MHKYGAKIFIQLLHAGVNGIDRDAETVSDVAEFRNGNRGHEMTEQRMQETKEDFVKAALRAKAAGFDGIELHGCHSYLHSQFMSSRLNHRADRYGEDKTLYTKETLQAIREACGDDFVVGIRLAAFEPTLEEGMEHAKEIAPYTDFLDISYGYDCEAVKPEDFQASAAVYGAKKIKEMLPDMPVFGVDHINSQADVEYALAQGLDMADIGRAALVDPEFANHVLNGEPAGACLHCKDCMWGASDKTVCPGQLRYQKRKA